MWEWTNGSEGHKLSFAAEQIGLSVPLKDQGGFARLLLPPAIVCLLQTRGSASNCFCSESNKTVLKSMWVK